MPLFNYIAIDKEGKQKEGTLEVGSQNEAISRIKEMGYSLKEVAEVKYTPRKKRKLPKEKKAESEGDNGDFIERVGNSLVAPIGVLIVLGVVLALLSGCPFNL